MQFLTQAGFTSTVHFWPDKWHSWGLFVRILSCDVRTVISSPALVRYGALQKLIFLNLGRQNTEAQVYIAEIYTILN